MMSAPELSRLVKAAEVGSAAREVMIETTEEERAAVAARFGLLALDALSAETSVRAEAAGIRVTGRVLAEAVQACVVSGEAVSERIDAPLDLLFAPEASANPDEEVEIGEADLDVLPFDGQAIDIGEAVAQTLGLALDPYPRAEGSAVEAARQHILSEEEAVAARSPFAALQPKARNEAD